MPQAFRDHLLAGGTGQAPADGAGAVGYTWLPGREALEVAPHAVRDHTGAWHHGDLVVLCTGAAHTGAAGRHLAGFERPPAGCGCRCSRPGPTPARSAPRSRTATRCATTLRSSRPRARCRRSTPPQPPRRRRLDGSLTIGDTHAYDEPFAFGVDVDACEHLRGRAEKLLGAQLPPTQRRWAGVYSQVTSGEFYHRSAVAPGVVLVTGPGGRGMTCAPAIAGETFA